MKFTDLTSTLKEAMIGSSRVWVLIPNESYETNLLAEAESDSHKTYLNVFTGVMIKVYIDEKGEVLKIK